jgi:tetratricopeptide (TPR) repeat protein
MLYQIIPPILVILSFVGIVIFFVKKSAQIVNLDDEEILAQERIDMLAEAGFFRRIIIRIKNLRWQEVKHFLLVIVESLLGIFRMIFLKLESKSRQMSDLIRKNKNNSSRQNKVENIEKDDIINKVINYQPKKKTNYLQKFKKTISADSVEDDNSKRKEVIIHNKRNFKSTVSDKVVTPQLRTEMKDRLEELLIERIAANPKDVEAYERLGEYYMEIDSINDAKECFKQVLKLDPKNRNVKYRMKRLEEIIRRK